MNEIYEELIENLLEKGFGSVDNWFTQVEIQNLREELLNRYNNDDFKVAGIGNQLEFQLAKSIRNDEILWLYRDRTVEVEKCFFQKLDGFKDYLNRTCFAGINETEFHYAVYNPGSFYKRHVDRFQNDDRRRFSMVLYLTDNWQDGDGGELMIYKPDTEVKIQPKAGTVVFFDSALEHEVLVSRTERLSLTGWMKTL